MAGFAVPVDTLWVILETTLMPDTINCSQCSCHRWL